MRRLTFVTLCILLAVSALAPSHATAQPLTKAHVAGLIARVENNVDEFRDYLERRGDNARDAKDDAKDSGRASGRRRGGQGATESQKARAADKKDALDEALDDLNGSTNRLRRRFDATDKWIETKVQVENVVDDARKINQAVTRGSYGAEVARLWAALRVGINDLARAYGVPPLGV